MHKFVRAFHARSQILCMHVELGPVPTHLLPTLSSGDFIDITGSIRLAFHTPEVTDRSRSNPPVHKSGVAKTRHQHGAGSLIPRLAPIKLARRASQAAAQEADIIARISVCLSLSRLELCVLIFRTTAPGGSASHINADQSNWHRGKCWCLSVLTVLGKIY